MQLKGMRGWGEGESMLERIAKHLYKGEGGEKRREEQVAGEKLRQDNHKR